MKEDKGGGWSTVGDKTGKKGKPKKGKQAGEEKLLEGDEKLILQYRTEEDKSKKWDIHPNCELDAVTLEFLDPPVFHFTAFLNKTFSRYDGVEGCTAALAENDELLDATIFCFKAIGGCVSRATKCFEKDKKVVPLFWRQLITLRNSLVHHLLNDTLPDECLRTLGIVVTDWSQIYDYFRATCRPLPPNKPNTYLEIKKKEERYKRFHDVIGLALMLRREFPRSERGKQDGITQDRYLSLIRRVIRKIMRYSEGIRLDEEGMQYLKRRNSVKYFALQNCLEFLATLTTPSEDYRILTSACRNKLLNESSQAISCLETLGETRNGMMHTKNVIMNDEELCDNLLNIRAVCHILVPVELNDERVKTPKQPSNPVPNIPTTPVGSTKLLKKFGVKFTLAEEVPLPVKSKQVVLQQLPAKVGIIPQNPMPPVEQAKNAVAKQSGTKKAPPKMPIFKK